MAYRDHVIAWVKDFSRAVDYLATRQDLSINRLAMFGVSWGGRMGSIIPAIDDRLKVQVLVVGGFSMQRPMPEVDQVNVASRVAIPTLMLNGRYDFFFPMDTSQLPMFEAFRTPKDQERSEAVRWRPRHSPSRADQGDTDLAGSVPTSFDGALGATSL